MGPRLMTTVIAVVSTPIIVRLLGPGGYGDYAVLLSIYSLYMIPISSAITEGVQKFVGEDRDDHGWSERVLQFYFALALSLALIGVAVLVAFTTLGFTRFIGEEFAFYFYVLAAFVFVGQFRAFSMHALLGFGLENVNGPLSVVKKVVTVVLGVVLVYFGLDVFGMLVGHIVGNGLIAAMAGYVILRRISVRRLIKIPDATPYREFLSYNGLNIVLVLLVMSLFHVDVVMVRTLVDSDTTGFYKAALALAELIWIVPVVLQTLLLHSSSTLWSQGRTEEITALAGRITRYTTLLVLLMAVGLAILADRFVPLYYGQEFTVATTPLLLLLPGAIGFAVARPLQAICQGSGQLKPLILATGIAAVLNIVLNAILIPLFGMVGAAVATSIGYGSMFFLLVWASREIGYDPLFDFRPGRITLTVVISGLLLFGVEGLIGNDILALLVIPVLGVILYTGAAILSGALEVEELLEILEPLPIPFVSDLASQG